MKGPFMFVGEMRSPTAVKMGVTWEDGRLCADTLHRALIAADINPKQARFVNLWQDDGTYSPSFMGRVRSYYRLGFTIVGMGQKVQEQLRKANVPHRKLIHPAARGRVRGTRIYQAHVAAVLLGERTICNYWEQPSYHPPVQEQPT